MSVEKFDNSDYAMTHCRECGVELTDEEKKYYTCYCKKCKKKADGRTRQIRME